MKKFMAAFLSLALIFALCACGNPSEVKEWRERNERYEKNARIIDESLVNSGADAYKGWTIKDQSVIFMYQVYGCYDVAKENGKEWNEVTDAVKWILYSEVNEIETLPGDTYKIQIVNDYDSSVVMYEIAFIKGTGMVGYDYVNGVKY